MNENVFVAAMIMSILMRAVDADMVVVVVVSRRGGYKF